MITFGLVGFSASHEDVAVILMFLRVVIGGLFATLLYSFCALIAGTSARMVEHVDRTR